MSSVKKNISWNVLLTVSGYIFPILTFPYVTRILGAASFGLANFAQSIVDYAIIFSNLGIATVGCKFISMCNDDRDKRSEIFSQLITLHITCSAIILMIYTACILTIPQLKEHEILYLVGIMKIISNIFLVEWLFQGIQDFRYITLRSLAIRILYVISVFIFVREQNDYDIYFFLSIAQVLVNALVNWKFSKKHVVFHFSFKGCRQFVFPMFSMGINRILLSFYLSFNIILLDLYCGDASVGYYVTATKIYGIFLSLFNAFNGVSVPHLNSLLGKGETNLFKKYVTDSFSLVILTSIPLIVGGMILAPEIIKVIAGPGYERSILPFQIVLILVFLVGIAQILEDQILLSFKKFKEILICTSISAILAVILLFVFVPTYAEIASAIALSLPHVVEFILLYHYAKKSIDIKFPIIDLFKNILCSIPIIVICLIFKQLLSNSLGILLVAGATSALYYLILQYYILHNDFLRRQLFFKNRTKC